MIDNDYVYETNLGVDLDYFKNLALSKQNKNVEGLMNHQRLVKDDPYMESIRKQYPFLSNMYNIYTTREFNSMPIHIDAKRKCAINIPIQNTETSDTIFYELSGIPELEHVPKFVYHLVKSTAVEVFRFSLLKPTLINNSVPHSVVNSTNKERIIISWSISDQYDFDKVKNILKFTNI